MGPWFTIIFVALVFALQCQADNNVDNRLFYTICDIISHEVSLDKDQVDCGGGAGTFCSTHMWKSVCTLLKDLSVNKV